MAHILLQLINMAVSGTPPKTSGAGESESGDSQRDQEEGGEQSSKAERRGDRQVGKGAEVTSEAVKSLTPPTSEGNP